MDIAKRQQELTKLKAFTINIEKEVTLLLQNLKWDPNLTIEVSLVGRNRKTFSISISVPT